MAKQTIRSLSNRSWFELDGEIYRTTMPHGNNMLCKQFNPMKINKVIEIFFEGYVAFPLDTLVEPCSHPKD